MIRRYGTAAPVAELQRTLTQGYLPLLARQPGFVEYSAFTD